MDVKKFNIFISWSKSPSKEIAEQVKFLLEKIFPDPIISFFVSSSDKNGIGPGDRFNKILDENLETSNYGILILTKNNFSQPWIMFEAGALSKDSQISKIVPVFFNREESSLEAPLKPFNHISFNMIEFETLVFSIKKAQFGATSLTIEQKELLKHSLVKHWDDFEKNVNILLTDSAYNIKEITENVTTLMMDENAYEKILSKRDAHLEELIENLSSDKSKRIIIFGGISTKIREESTIRSLAIWLINNPNSKLFICHESSDVARLRGNDLSDKVYQKEVDKSLEIQKRKVEELNKMKNNIMETVGDKFRKNIFFIEIIKTVSIYATIHGDIMYFTPVLDKRSSDTFTFKLKKSKLINDVIDYIESRIDRENSVNKNLLKELLTIKSENNE